MKGGMRLLTLALAVAAASAASLGPITPDKHPSTRLVEAIRKMRLSLDRELLALARLEAARAHVAPPVALPISDRQAGDNVGSSFAPSPDLDDGFSEVTNDGMSTFEPIRPGAAVPAANASEEPMESQAPFVPGGSGGGNDGPEPSTAPPSIVPVPIPPVATPVGPIGISPIQPPEVTVLPGDNPPVVPVIPVIPVTVPVGQTPEPGFEQVPRETDMPGPGPGPGVVPVSGMPPGVSPGVGGEDGGEDGGSSPFPATGVVNFTPNPSPSNPLTQGSGGEGSEPGVTIDPSFSPESSPGDEDADGSGDDDDGSVCFPADATVEVQGGGLKRMADVELGDRVRVSGESFSEVFMFTHKMADVRHNFVRIFTESGHALALTKSHYLYVNGSPAAASVVRRGDSLMLADGTISSVVNVENEMGRGLFNPQTVHGDIIVNGVRATTYTTAVDMSVAHALLTPLRAAFSSMGWSLSAFDTGADRLAKIVPSGSLVA